MSRPVRLTNAHGREAFDSDVKRFFGLEPKDKWSVMGHPPITVQGITMWVGPYEPGPFRIRAMCRCPKCGKEMPIGRINQHWRVHA